MLSIKASSIKVGNIINIQREFSLHLDPYYGIVDIKDAEVKEIAISQSDPNIRYFHLGKYGWVKISETVAGIIL